MFTPSDPSSTLTPSLPEAAAAHFSREDNPYVLSYLALRQAVGYIALLLPWVVYFGANINHTLRWRDSISGYYYTDMRNILVGSLCAIAMFQMACRGYKNDYGHLDMIASWLSSIFALGVALFPTRPKPGDWTCANDPTRILLGKLHVTCAVLLFCTLAFFCLYLFRLSNSASPTRRKFVRNRIFTICGCGIVGSMLLILFARKYLAHAYFIGETGALTFFGIAWLVKGQALLKDKPQPRAEIVKPRIPKRP